MGVRVTFEPATVAHAEALALTMRPADLAELQACGCPDARTGLLLAIKVSDFAFAMLFDGAPAALFGIQERGGPELADGARLVWALTGQAVQRHAKDFLRASRAVLAALLERHAALVNWVDARYLGAVRWAKWLGFEVGAPQPYGPSGLPFHHIVMRRP